MKKILSCINQSNRRIQRHCQTKFEESWHQLKLGFLSKKAVSQRPLEFNRNIKINIQIVQSPTELQIYVPVLTISGKHFTQSVSKTSQLIYTSFPGIGLTGVLGAHLLHWSACTIGGSTCLLHYGLGYVVFSLAVGMQIYLCLQGLVVLTTNIQNSLHKEHSFFLLHKPFNLLLHCMYSNKGSGVCNLSLCECPDGQTRVSWGLCHYDPLDYFIDIIIMCVLKDKDVSLPLICRYL